MEVHIDLDEKVQEPCIYRVPNRMRVVKPEAYTPKVVVIGPLHRSPKSTAKDDAETSSNPWHLKKDYIKMEVTKKTYFESYTKRVGKDTIREMRKTIQTEEKNIRNCYEESTEWIPSELFVDLILQDSIFIMELIIRLSGFDRIHSDDRNLDFAIVMNDLLLLENQLPYFIFDSLFSFSMTKYLDSHTLDSFILRCFGLKIEEKKNFMHLTDMYRCVYKESLDYIPPREYSLNRVKWSITELRNAENLSNAGVNFKSYDYLDLSKQDGKLDIKITRDKSDSELTKLPTNKRERVEGVSLHVELKKGCLSMPSFWANDRTDMILRNVIAFEQCQHGIIPFTSHYIQFLNALIVSDRDVELLSEKGVVMNNMGRPSLVVDMVNKLKVGVYEGYTSQYYDIAIDLKAHYKSRRKRCWATLRKVYFSDLWTGTATLAAVLLLLLTLVGTVASVIQAYESFK